jgi:hypothetical protein
MHDLNRIRGAASLLHPLKLIFQQAENWNHHLRASHIAGVENTTADSLSRLERSGDYQLDQEVLDWGLRKLRVRVNIDLFATRQNRKTHRYLSVKKEEGAHVRDALSVEWGGFFPLIHPPIPLLLRCLRKVEEEGVKEVMIVPHWKGQSWNHLLNRLTIRRLNLGLATNILIPGPTMARTGLQLPPGTMEMCLVNGRTNRDG